MEETCYIQRHYIQPPLPRTHDSSYGVRKAHGMARPLVYVKYDVRRKVSEPPAKVMISARVGKGPQLSTTSTGGWRNKTPKV